jgi:hypothetical protein
LGGVTEQFRGDVCVSSHSILPRNEFRRRKTRSVRFGSGRRSNRLLPAPGFTQ